MPKAFKPDAQELRVESKCFLRKSKTPKSNITKEESKALKELRENQEKDHVDKMEGLLTQLAYRTINTDSTNKLKATFIPTLKRIKRETNMGEGMYRTMYPTGCITPKFYGLPKIHKTGIPLRPVVSSGGSVTYGLAKVIAKVLNPLVGKLPHYI